MVLALYVALAVITLVAAPFSSALGWMVPWLAVPLLAEFLWLTTSADRSRLTRWAIGALLLTAVADIASDVLTQFTSAPASAGCAAWAAASAVWVVTLWPARGASYLFTRRGWLVPYALLAASAYFGVAQTATGAALGVVVVNLVLAAAAGVAASGLPQPGPWAGALYFLAQVLAAMARYAPGWDRPGMLFWIQAAYLTSASLLAWALLRHDGATRPMSTIRMVGLTD